MGDQWEEAAKNFKAQPGAPPSVFHVKQGDDFTPKENQDYKVWLQDHPNASTNPDFKPSFGQRTASNVIGDITAPFQDPVGFVKGLGMSAAEGFSPLLKAKGLVDKVKGLRAMPSEERGPRIAADVLETTVPLALGIGGVKGIRALTRLNPEIASEQAFRPAPSDSDFPQIAPSAFSDVKTFGGPTPKGLFGRPKVGVKDLAPGGNTTAAIEALQNQGLEPWLARARSINTQINGDQIVTATRDAIPRLMWTKDPAGAAALVREAQQTWGGRQFTPDDFRDFLKTGNAGLSRFYKQAPTGQQSAITAGTAPAISDAETSGIRKALYDALDPEGAGAGPRQIQERTGAVTNLRNAAERRSNAILGEKPVSPAAAAGRIIASPFEAATIPFRSNPESTISRVLHPIQGRSDALIGGLYRQAPDAPPLPAPSPFPAPRGLLGPGPTITPAPADTSFVRSAPAMTQPPNPARALGAGPQVFTTPPPADTSFVRGAQGMAQPLNPGRALPPAPNIHITDVPADMSFVRGVPPAAHQRVNMEPRMLPQGTAPFTQGTSVPDILGRPGQTTNKLLEAPKPGEPPLNVLPEDPSLRVPSYMPSGIRRPRQLGPAK